MARYLVFIFLLAIPAVSRENAPSAGHSVAVLMDFEGGYSEISVEEMKREVTSLLAPCGVHPAWRDAGNVPPNEVFERIAVAHFSGSCRIRTAAGENDDGPALGFTHVSDGHVLPFVRLDCNRVRRLVRSSLQNEEPAHAESLFGRALGRVLVHELYHVLAATGQHGEAGVTKPALSPDDLLRYSLPLERAGIGRIRLKMGFR